MTHWTYAALADEASARGVVAEISAYSIGCFLREVDLKRHCTCGWIKSPLDDLQGSAPADLTTFGAGAV
ncbi:hypothetical protein [Thiocapsa rosea]|uniref:hypothetical protein n=1 Tax=Thiocapsa rosea TaxID=69360 RepID=UPI000EAFADAA|nr:hypothetical protein [Thiocapsa rosea]